MSDTVVSLHGGAVPAARVADPAILKALKIMTDLAEKGEISSIAIMAMHDDGSSSGPVSSFIAPTNGHARMLIGSLEEMKFDLLKGIVS